MKKVTGILCHTVYPLKKYFYIDLQAEEDTFMQLESVTKVIGCEYV